MRRMVGLVAVAAVLALVPGPSQATDADRLGPSQGAGTAMSEADGLLVTSGLPLTPATLHTVGRLLGRSIVSESAVGDSVVSLKFDRPVPAAAVALVAPGLRALAGITHIEPDLHATTDALPDDPYFDQQTNLWAGPLTPDPSVPDYSVQAPAIWRATLGVKKVVVAVVDSGVVAHPDLLGQTVAGYDMISNPVISRDGNGRDANASDPGNWSDGTYCKANPSLWHGSHVMGVIVAKSDNGIGIAGIAPGVAVQPVRVMGQCGGSISDIIAGIRWASGGTVDGVPANKTPAKVINVSLGSDSTTCPQAYQDVIDEARGRGSLVVVSAGNEHDYVTTHTPANCQGVLSVGASTTDGRRTSYTNAGPTIGIMAPGGTLPEEGYGIWSTIDSGVTGAAGSTYAQRSGTSMAAPAVAAAAALVESLGTFTPAQVEQMLKSAATTPPTYDAPYDCGTWCGAGLLNLANIPAPIGKPVLVGTARSRYALSFTPGGWNGHLDAVVFQWLRNGAAISGATRTSYTLTSSDLGRTLTVRSTAHTAGFPAVSGLSAARAVPKATSSVSLRLSATTARRNRTRLVAAVSVSVSQGQSRSGAVRIYVSGNRIATVYPGSTTVKVRLPVFRSNGTFTVKAVYAGNTHVAVSSRSIRVKVIS